MDFSLKKGDLLPPIASTLTDNNGNPIDLTGAAVSLVYGLPYGVENTKTAAIVDAVAGKVKYDWASGDTNTVGIHRAVWKVTFAGKIESFPNSGWLEIEIQENFA